MRVARVQAQAKINRLLHVFARDSVTGYHDIGTVFERIDLADHITVRAESAGRTLDVTGPRVPAGGLGPVEKNLAYRAALEFADRAGWPQGFEIHLTKNIPVGGGLGGGSADAGGVLRALNALAPTPLTDDELWRAACALGSDVPFLTKDWTTAIGMRRGTELRDMSKLQALARDVLIVVPGFSIGTADAYRWLDEERKKSGFDAPTIDPQALAQQVQRSFTNHFEPIVNHFEPVVEARYPELRRIRERLLEMGAETARLAGSGSCVFGIFEHTPPSTLDLDFESILIPTRLSSRVVQVEVLE